MPGVLVPFLAAQACSFLAAATGVASEYISLGGLDISAFQVHYSSEMHIPCLPIPAIDPETVGSNISPVLPQLLAGGLHIWCGTVMEPAGQRGSSALRANRAVRSPVCCRRQCQLPHRQGVLLHKHHINITLGLSQVHLL